VGKAVEGYTKENPRPSIGRFVCTKPAPFSPRPLPTDHIMRFRPANIQSDQSRFSFHPSATCVLPARSKSDKRKDKTEFLLHGRSISDGGDDRLALATSAVKSVQKKDRL